VIRRSFVEVPTAHRLFQPSLVDSPTDQLHRCALAGHALPKVLRLVEERIAKRVTEESEGTKK